MQHLREQYNLRGVGGEGGDGRDPTLKNMGALMPYVKYRRPKNTFYPPRRRAMALRLRMPEA
jgi:hypothetical protein